MKKIHKTLIIKLGYSETLDQEISRKSSLGDVLRTSVLLHHFKTDQVTWLVDESARLLLEGNPYIYRILVYDLTTVLQLQSERFDTVINLEKAPGICALADSIDAWRRYGFRFNGATGETEAHDGAERILSMCLNKEEKKNNTTYWQEALMEIVGARWTGEEYVLGYRPKSPVIYDIGFNHEVGTKWPNKSWSRDRWEQLESMLQNDHLLVSWQKGQKNITEYIDWVHSCELLVTNDSLGLHIALALEKRVVVLFGPTAHREICLYNRGLAVLPDKEYGCLPCLSSTCINTKHCMEDISAERVHETILSLRRQIK